MNLYKRTGRLAGLFYIVATAAGIIGISLTQSTLDASDYLAQISAHENQIRAGAFFELIMAVAVVAIAVTVYPVLKRYNASVAVGYVSARLAEGILIALSTLSLLSLLTLSQEFAAATTPDTSYFHTAGELLLGVQDWSGHVIMDVTAFSLSALLFYALLYRTGLVPRWLSGVGLIGAGLYWAAGLLVLFDAVEPLSSPHIALQAPLGLQEMVLAVWLIVKGFVPAEADQVTV